jgi:hypothetical protein
MVDVGKSYEINEQEDSDVEWLTLILLTQNLTI